MLFSTFQTEINTRDMSFFFALEKRNEMEFFNSLSPNGRMAQWLRRPPTEREIPGSNPGVIVTFFFFFFLKEREDKPVDCSRKNFFSHSTIISRRNSLTFSYYLRSN